MKSFLASILIALQLLSIGGLSLDLDTCCRSIVAVVLTNDQGEDLPVIQSDCCQITCCKERSCEGCETERIQLSSSTDSFLIPSVKNSPSPAALTAYFFCIRDKVAMSEGESLALEESFVLKPPSYICNQQLITYG